MDKDDLKVFQALFAKNNTSPGCEIHVKILTSKSSLKITDFPYFGINPQLDENGQLKPICSEDIAIVMSTTSFAKDFRFYETSGPRLTCNSQ